MEHKKQNIKRLIDSIEDENTIDLIYEIVVHLL